MRAATWPDEIRGKHNPNDHPTWHYTNLPLIPPRFPEKPTLSGKENVVWAIQHNQRILDDAKADPEKRAIALAWLEHLVGDIRQPLHAVALVTKDWPKGDRGGNLFWVRPGKTGITLHHYWDVILGSSRNIGSAFKEAERIRIANRDAISDTAKPPKEWAIESRMYAKTFVYLNGHLKGGASKTEAASLPSGYGRQAKGLAEGRAKTAGERLAHTLQRQLR